MWSGSECPCSQQIGRGRKENKHQILFISRKLASWLARPVIAVIMFQITVSKESEIVHARQEHVFIEVRFKKPNCATPHLNSKAKAPNT